MSEYTEVEQPFLQGLESLGWTAIDQGYGVPQDAAPSRPPRDSAGAIRRALTANDTIKAPLATSWEPATAIVGSWNREQLFAQGSLTLGELVAGRAEEEERRRPAGRGRRRAPRRKPA